MKTIIHDLDAEETNHLLTVADQVIHANGRYAPCQGCFKCWTKHPAACAMKDSLHCACRVLGTTDELTIITENTYGGYSAPVKNLLDRSIGMSTPLSTYRGGQMHHSSSLPMCFLPLSLFCRVVFSVDGSPDFNLTPIVV